MVEVTNMMFGGCAKVGVTVAAAVMASTQVPVPLHPPPLQPTKMEPPVGVALSVTLVP